MPEAIAYKTKPFAHQETALECWRGKDRFALFCEMGTGKTWIAINRAGELSVTDAVREALVLAPRSLLGVWQAEIEKHCPVKATVLVLDKPAAWENLAAPPPSGLRFIILNYEQLLTARFEKLLLHPFGIMILDESTMVKNSFAKRSKKTRILASRIPRVAILTGNPTPNGPLDLYSQFHILDPAILGISNFYAFRNRYAVMGGKHVHGKPVQVLGYKEDLIEQELRPRMAPYVFRIQKHECLDLPPKIYQIRDIQLAPDQARAYKTMRDQAVAEFKGRVLAAPIILARMTRLAQISGGFFPDPEGKTLTPFDPNPKLMELEQIVEELSGKFIVWTRFRSELGAIAGLMEKLGIGFVRLDGDAAVEDRQKAIEDFQNDPATRAFIGITSCGKFGLTLTAAETMIYYSNSFEFEVRNQSEDRVHRAGLTHPVTYIDLIMRGTIDRLILSALQGKKDLSEFIKNLTSSEVF